MTMMPPLPSGVRQFIAQNTHPGLALDKYSSSWEENAVTGKLSEKVQKPTLEQVVGLSQEAPVGLDFGALLTRWKRDVGIDPSRNDVSTFACRTIGDLTLHLSRASALENAGICLHPLYGFVYLPGSGLKGMARAYAETVWLRAETKSDEEKRVAWRKIEDVFGWAANPDRRNQIENPDHPAQRRLEREDVEASPEITSHSGNIVFHDAWPEKWPKLIVDITNNHHPRYYEGKDAPGDWEDPVPVYFLAIGPDNVFNFALSKRCDDVADDLVQSARQWLTGALCHLGAGAKTNAGYGFFAPLEDQAPSFSKTDRHETFECELELITPAFLAGANQKAEDCVLRSASLRGQLRWWWRTMHAGWVDVNTLREMESAIWGDTCSGGAVRILVKSQSNNSGVCLVPGKKHGRNNNNQTILVPDDEFLSGNNIAKTQRTQPVFYAAYGTDEMKAGDTNSRKQRYCALPNSKWTVSTLFRASGFRGYQLSVQQIEMEFKSALWLLCNHGGMGSKSRNGFGSFKLNGFDTTINEIKERAIALRNNLNCNDAYNSSWAESPSLEEMPPFVEESFGTSNYWWVLDRIGAAMMQFASSKKHSPDKSALGLPRKIHGPSSSPRPHQKSHKPPLYLTVLKSPKGEKGRFSAPIFYHVFSDTNGNLGVRVTAFPSIHLPDATTSKSVLKSLLVSVKSTLSAVKSSNSTAKNSHGTSTQSSPIKSLKVGSTIQVVLLEDKNKKGGWKAKHEESGRTGSIQNSVEVPADKKPGDRVALIVAMVSVDGKTADFKWPKK